MLSFYREMFLYDNYDHLFYVSSFIYVINKFYWTYNRCQRRSVSYSTSKPLYRNIDVSMSHNVYKTYQFSCIFFQFFLRQSAGKNARFIRTCRICLGHVFFFLFKLADNQSLCKISHSNNMLLLCSYCIHDHWQDLTFILWFPSYSSCMYID